MRELCFRKSRTPTEHDMRRDSIKATIRDRCCRVRKLALRGRQAPRAHAVRKRTRRHAQRMHGFQRRGIVRKRSVDVEQPSATARDDGQCLASCNRSRRIVFIESRNTSHTQKSRKRSHLPGPQRSIAFDFHISKIIARIGLFGPVGRGCRKWFQAVASATSAASAASAASVMSPTSGHIGFVFPIGFVTTEPIRSATRPKAPLQNSGRVRLVR